jgi:multisubunit Na+/H+ antiporter MnhE subunit
MTRPTSGPVLETIGWAVAGSAVWLATLSAVTLPEACFAVAAGLASGVFTAAARRSLGGSWRFRPRWALWAPQIVATMATEVVDLARATVRRPPQGRLRTLEMPAEEDREQAGARAALATLALGSTPGSIVVDSDPEERTLTVHTLVSHGPDLATVVRR